MDSGQTSHARSSQAYRLSVPWTARPVITPAGRRGISRFSRMEIPYMHRFSDRAGSPGGSRIAPPAMLPSGLFNGVGTPNSLSSRLNSPACTYPCQRFTGALADDGA